MWRRGLVPALRAFSAALITSVLVLAPSVANAGPVTVDGNPLPTPTSTVGPTTPPSSAAPPPPAATTATGATGATTSPPTKPPAADGKPTASPTPPKDATKPAAAPRARVTAAAGLTKKLGVTKEADVQGGGPLTPGKSIAYTLSTSCSGLEAGCTDAVLTDVLPAGLDVTNLPTSVPGQYDVAYDTATRKLTVTFVQPLRNPPGTIGLPDGSQVQLEVGLRLPVDTQLLDGATITNTADVTGTNSLPATASVTTPVSIPLVVTPHTTKGWAPNSAIAQSGDASAITLGVKNSSSTSAKVSSLTVQDSTKASFDNFDFTSATFTAFPKGANQAQLLVCTKASDTCTDADYQAGPVASTPGALELPAGVVAGNVTAVRVSFANSAGSVLPGPDTSAGGSVRLGMTLRSIDRSTGAANDPKSELVVNNCAATTAQEATQGAVTSSPACANFTIVPNIVSLVSGKTFFPDANGNYRQDSNEYAVVGQSSGVSALMTVQNASPFPVGTLTITEPSALSTNEFDKVDVTSIRVLLPTGATQAVLTVTCRDGSAPAARPFTSSQESVPTGCPAGSPPSQLTVTYTGIDGQGAGTIATGATATLGFTGNLNALVDNSDVPSQGNPGAGVVNCADTAVARDLKGSGTGSGTACTTLPVQPPRTSGPGVKTPSQTSVPPGQPIVFGLNLTNNGNIPLVTPGVADPQVDGTGNPTTPNPFDVLRVTGISVTRSGGTPPVTLEVYDPAKPGWVAYDVNDAALLLRATGVRATVAGNLAPGQDVNVTISTLRRDGVPDDTPITNCAYTIGADGTRYPGIDPWCSPTLRTGPANADASVNKNIVPGSLPRPLPGLAPQKAQVKLALVNDGNLSLKRLVATDVDTAFFDGVDFVQLDGVNFPPGADRVQLDVCVSAALCAAGTFVAGTPTGSTTPGLPTGVTAAQVRGLRVTFTSSNAANGGYNLTPGSNLGGGGACTGASVCFSVTPRSALLSDGGPVPDTLTDTVNGGLESPLQPPGTLQPIAPDNATVTLTRGTPQLAFGKGPDSNVAPGQPAPFTLTTTNTGTANVPNLVVTDPIPAGLDFDDTWVGSTVGGVTVPYAISVTNLPAGVDPPATVTFTPTVVGTRITEVSWDFGGWPMPPNARVQITFHTKLSPGAVAGVVITNKAGATSSVPGLTCQPGPADPSFLTGEYCAASAQVTTSAGAAFNAKKWVAGNPALGWYNTVSGAPVAVGGPTCPLYAVNGKDYTAYPCVALVNPGDVFDYVVQVVNAGTEPGTQMRIIDAFPAPGDTGVVLTGEQRGTQWANRPLLLTPPALVRPPTPGGVALIDTYTDGTVCGTDLDLTGATSCPAGSWTAAFGPSNTAVKMDLTFRPVLAPAGEVNVGFSMKTPLDVPQVSDPTIAWNSFGHAETTIRGNGAARVLPPTEPLKVGVATAYNRLQLVKAIGANPANLPLSDLAFPFHATCVINPQGGSPTTVLDKDYEVSVSTPVTVSGLPAGARCEVYEKDALGGVTDHPPANPVVVTITPAFGTAPSIQTATITNSFPNAVLLLDKVVNGKAASFGVGPFEVQVNCTFRGATVQGFPQTMVFNGSGQQQVSGVPAGARCTAAETATGSATTVTYDPPLDPPGEGSAPVTMVNDQVRTITVTNTFDLGNMAVDKRVTGAGTPAFSGGPFTFSAACTFNGGTYSRSLTATWDPATQTYLSSVATGPIGSTCVVHETDSGGADAAPAPVSVTLEKGPAQGAYPSDTVIAAFTNEFSAATVQLTKTLAGPASGEAWATDASFTVQVTCQRETTVNGAPERETLFSGPVTIKGGQTLPVTTGGTPVTLPVGARCWAVETVTGGATAAAVEPSSWETAPPVVVQDPASGLQQLTITATNTFDYGTLVVAKVLAGGAAGLAADIEFQLQATCVLPTGAGETPIITNEPLTLQGGQTKTLEKLPVGARCWVAETANGGATATTVDHGSAADAAVVTAAGAPAQASITATNTFEAASVVVSKTVVGAGSAGPYTFTMSCLLTGSDGTAITVPLPAADAQFTLSSGQKRAVAVPAGATCTAAEVSPPAGDTVSIIDSDANTAGGVGDGIVGKVSGAATMGFTNTYPAAPVTPTPGPGSGNAGNGSGDHLPGTGTQTSSYAVAGVLALLAGLMLVLVSRRRRPTRA